MIELREVTVRLGGHIVVDRVTLTVESGSWLSLIGPNGAGKTTLLRAVAGLVAYTGQLRVMGEEVRDLTTPQTRARLIATVPQTPVLPEDMTVAEYALLGRTAHLGLLGRAGARDHDAVGDALDRLDLTALRDRRLDELSGGESQRAVLARALAQATPVLLLDEPTAALDVGRQQEVLELVSELRGDSHRTVLGAMHDLTLAGQYADGLGLMDGGELVTVGTPEQVLTEPLVSRHYRAHVRVTQQAGATVVLPTRRQAAA